MKYVYLVLTLLALSLTSVSAQSDFYYYDLQGNPVYLNPIDTLVAVRLLDGSSSSAQTFAGQQTSLSDALTFSFAGNGTFVFRLEEGFGLASTMAALRMNEEVAMVNPVAQNTFGEKWTMNNRLLVMYLQSTNQEQADSLASAHGLTLVEVVDDSMKLVILEYNSPTTDDITAICRSYYQSGLCLAVEPEITSKAHAASTDPLYANQWQLENTGQTNGTFDADIDWPEARLYDTVNWVPHIIAVLDGGFQLDHEDLESSLFLLEYDGAGFTHWINRPDSNAVNDCDGSETPCWHGTAVLGIIAANTENGIGLAGADSRARVMPIKITDVDGLLNQSTVLRGLTWARVPHGPISANILCMTQNFPNYQSGAIEAYLQAIYQSGRPIICSAGNLGVVKYPANLPSVLAVGMTDSNDGFGAGSAAGSTLDVVAPGWDVWSLDLMGNAGLSSGSDCNNNPNYNCGLAGTSFSAPLVAGVVARMLSANPWFMGPAQQPYSAELIYEVLRHSADRAPYGGGDGRVNDLVGWGRVNADHAVAIVKRGDTNNDGQLNVSDAVFIIAHIFGGGPTPQPNPIVGDANCSGGLSISDAVFIIAYIFGGGPDPRNCLQ